MFGHIFINRLKCAFRDRQTIFWSFLFPLVLATLFSMAFSNLNKGEVFQTIELGVVVNDDYKADTAFQNALDATSSGEEADKDLFKVTKFDSQAAADESLKSSWIAGYILYQDGEPQVVVKQSGLYQTIMVEFVERYLQLKKTFTDIAHTNPEALQGMIADLNDERQLFDEVSPTAASPNNTLTYFYALIAMACLYGGFWGMKEVTAVQADQSYQGARINLAPVHKLKVFGSALCAVIAVQFAAVLVLIAYLGLAIKVDFGNNLGYIVLAGFAGSCMGVLLGAVIAALTKGKESLKVAVVIVVSMVFSFCSGLMVADVKYAITTAAPVLAYLNPANLVADAFYSLYYYTSHARFFLNIGLLFAYSLVLFMIVYFAMRRQRYESI